MILTFIDDQMIRVHFFSKTVKEHLRKALIFNPEVLYVTTTEETSLEEILFSFHTLIELVEQIAAEFYQTFIHPELRFFSKSEL